MDAMALLAFMPADCASDGKASASGREGPPPSPAVRARPTLLAAEEAHGATLAFAGGVDARPRVEVVGATGGAFGAPDPDAPSSCGWRAAGFRLGAMLAAMAECGREAVQACGARGRRSCSTLARTRTAGTAWPARKLGPVAATTWHCCTMYRSWSCLREGWPLHRGRTHGKEVTIRRFVEGSPSKR